MKRALLVVDIQYDFLPGGALAVKEGESIIPFALDRMRDAAAYDLVVASQDWHPPDHGSFASVQGTEPFEIGELAGLSQVFWPDHCVQRTDGARIEKRTREELVDIGAGGRHTLIVKKGQDPEVDSYSVFFDNAKRVDTGLDRALKSYDIEAIDIVGLAFDYCVKYSALDGVSLGYRTRVLMEGTRAIDPSLIEQHQEEMRAAGIECLV
jgi:nicotinamidase/pyrazinamidase